MRKKKRFETDIFEADSPGNEGESEHTAKTRRGSLHSTSLLNVRKYPEANSPVVGYIEKGDRVLIRGETEEFYQIECENKRLHGYASKSYLLEHQKEPN